MNDRVALTLWPEWAYAVAKLGKDVENRSWAPPPYVFRKRIAIHGGTSIGGRSSAKTGFALTAVRAMTDVAEICGHDQARLRSITPGVISEEGCGIVAIATIAGVWRSPQPERWYVGDNLHGWLLEDVIALPRPVKCSGAQGLWRIPPDVLARVREQLAVAMRTQAAQASGSRATGAASNMRKENE